ncbi:class C beta-lactamase-related serine hydrolase [candidate division KSB1 bacterium]|nr:serine hydrolase [candidate division KSB1 bacterium]RQW03211.1 MAG: class C beta-lactamase-related serine hydrolase [candidate division KSB1 bacterium]
MRRWIKIMLAVLLVLFVFVIGLVIWYLSKAIPIGTGYTAKYLCSSTFLSLRNPNIVFAEDVKPVNPLARFITWELDMQEKTVVASAFGISAKAVYRDGCGCTLINGVSEEDLYTQSFFRLEKPHTTPHDVTIPWPAGDKASINPASIGLAFAPIERALDYAFSEPSPDQPRRTRAVLVVYDGQLIAERYAADFSWQTPILGWSMTKSVTNALVGVLVQKGLLNIYDPAAVPEWQNPGDPRRDITLDQLLRMSSGLTFQEIYQPLFDATNMLYGAADFAAFAAAKPLIHPRDSVWSYSSGTANIIARIVRQRAETLYENYYDFLRHDFFEKIGMTTAVIEPDPSGTFVGSSYCFATPRDWARFGLLYLQDGFWNGERILPEGWVRYSATPTAKASMGEYGALFWLNAGAPDNPAFRKWPDAPQDMLVAQGYQEQRLMIIPSKKLLVVRFGATSDRDAWDSNEFLKLLLPAFP